MARRRKQKSDPEESFALRRSSVGRHRHVAELHGENATLGLKRWARRRVLSYR